MVAVIELTAEASDLCNRLAARFGALARWVSAAIGPAMGGPTICAQHHSPAGLKAEWRSAARDYRAALVTENFKRQGGIYETNSSRRRISLVSLVPRTEAGVGVDAQIGQVACCRRPLAIGIHRGLDELLNPSPKACHYSPGEWGRGAAGSGYAFAPPLASRTT